MARSRLVRKIIGRNPQYNEPEHEIVRPTPVKAWNVKSPKKYTSYPFLCEFELALIDKQKADNHYVKTKFKVSESEFYNEKLSDFLMCNYLLTPLYLYLNPHYDFTESSLGFFTKCRSSSGGIVQRFFILQNKKNLEVINHLTYAIDTLILNDVLGLDYTKGNSNFGNLSIKNSNAYYFTMNSHLDPYRQYLNALNAKITNLTDDILGKILDEIQSRFETIVLFKLDRLFPEKIRASCRNYVERILDNNLSLLKSTTNTVNL